MESLKFGMDTVTIVRPTNVKLPTNVKPPTYVKEIGHIPRYVKINDNLCKKGQLHENEK